jgi:hypothetical protein
MTYRMYGTFIACLSLLALMLPATEASARSGSTPRGAFASMRSSAHLPAAHGHHRRNNVGAFWPVIGDFGYGPSIGEPIGGLAPPASNDVHYTYTYDVPWDWAHRFPPNVTPSDRPYVPSCSDEKVTVPGRYGDEQTLNITRCY